MIYWQTKTGPILVTITSPASFRLAQERAHHGVMSRLLQFSARIPFAAVAWSDDPRGPWRPFVELPANWNAGLGNW